MERQPKRNIDNDPMKWITWIVVIGVIIGGFLVYLYNKINA